MSHVTIKGAKGGGSSSFKQTPDNLRSNDTFEGVLGLCIGPIKGPTRGLKSIKLDGTAVENQDGQSNFTDTVVSVGNGDPLQFPQVVQLKLGAGAAPTQVGTTLVNNNGVGVPATKTLNNTNAEFIDLRFIVNQLFRQDKKGIYNLTATLKIEMKPVGSSTWINPTIGTASGGYSESGLPTSASEAMVRLYVPRSAYGPNGSPLPGRQNYGITGKTTSPAVYEVRIAVPNTGAYADTAWDVRVTLMERDKYTGGTDGENQEVRSIQWESIAAVYGKTMGDHEDWRGVAWMQIYGKASDQLTGVPEVVGEFDTKIVQVPPSTVFNPDTRQYTGAIWDGSWASAYTNDPAWVVSDAISDGLSGLSLLAPGSYLNKWDALEMSKWCSELVPNGDGGTHPRFSLNLAIREPMKGEDFIRYLAGAVGGMAWDQGDGEWRVKMDKPDVPVDLFTLDNIESDFIYSNTDVDTRYNDITMTFLNEEMDYREDRVRVFNNSSIAAIGRKPTTLVAVGCTNRQEAMRRALLRLLSATGETRVVNFTTNRRGRNIDHLDMILVADGELGDAAKRTNGRVVDISADRKTITLRDTVYLAPGVAYNLRYAIKNPAYNPETAAQPTNADWKKPTITQTRVITNAGAATGETRTLTLSEPLPDDAANYLAVALEAANLPTLPKLYRVTNVTYDDDGERVSLSALEVKTDKWTRADNVTKEDTVFQDLRGAVPSPLPPIDGNVLSLVRVPAEQGSNVLLTANWIRPPGAFINGFRVRYRINGGAWLTASERTQFVTLDLVDPVPGNYEVEITTLDRRGGASTPLLGSLEVTQTLIDATQIKYNDGRTVEEMQPAQPGADVTGDNTSKDTENVAGKPAEEIVGAIDQAFLDIGDLRATYGETLAAAEHADAARLAKELSIQAAADAAGARDLAAAAEQAALGHAGTANDAKNLAQTAFTDAALARTAAEQARDAALGGAGQSEAHRVASEAAANASGLAKTAAEQARDDARTKAQEADGSAQASAGYAEQAATASGAASQSATAASASQVSARLTVATALPSTVVDGGAYFTRTGYGAGPETAEALPLSGITVTEDGPVYGGWAEHIGTRGLLPWVPGRTYEIEAKVRGVAAPSGVPHIYLWGTALDANYNLTSPQASSGGFGIGTEAVPTPPGQLGVAKARHRMLDNMGPAVWVRYGLLMRRTSQIASILTDAEQNFISLTVRDVTELVEAEANASASATSAASAAASRDAAGEQAAAADASRVSAQTARAEAEGFRNQAAQSETNAAGSASSASQQAGVATNAASVATDYAINAQQNAAAAAGSASEASSSATAAGQQAAAATASAAEANTARGQAQAAQSQAALSESNAAGSASSAASSAILSAQTSKLAQLALADTFPAAFNPAAFTLGWGSVPPAGAAPLPVDRYTDSYYQGGDYSLGMRGVVPYETGRVYSLHAIVRNIQMHTYHPLAHFWVQYLDANYMVQTESAASHNTFRPTYEDFTASSLVSVGAVPGVPFTIQTGGEIKWLRFGLLLNRYENVRETMPAAVSRVSQLYIRDVTQQHLAGLSASASAASAASAAASQTAAGQQASAAESSRIAAQTAQGSAESARDSAAQSRTDAQGSASAASSAATVAVQARDAANTARGQAEGFANAASGSANSASGSATTAGQKADAAAASATSADTSRSQAQTAQSQASQAATDAAGSASSAVTSSAVSASASNAAQLALADTAPSTYNPGAFSLYFGGRPELTPAVPVGWGTAGYYQDASATENASALAPRALMPVETGKIFEVTADVLGVNTPTYWPWCGFWVVLYDANMNFISDHGPYNIFQATNPAPPKAKFVFSFGSVEGGPPHWFANPNAKYFRAGILINRYNPIGGDIIPGAVTRVTQLYTRDITGQYMANLAATAASTSASSAAASNTAAGQQASAAQSSATNAATSAGAASTSAGQASTSASNALGSANAAAVSATVSANSSHAAAVAAAALMPADFTQDDQFWMAHYEEAWENSRPRDHGWSFPVVDGAKVARSPLVAGGDGSSHFSRQLATRGMVRVRSERRYRATIRTRCPVWTGTVGIDFYWLATQANGLTHNGSIGPLYQVYPAGNQWYEWTWETTGAALFAATAAANTTFISPFIRVRAPDGSQIDVAWFKFEDITESYAAGQSASAAATSASTASTKAGEAGQSAAAANQSRLDAQAANGTAQTAASNASSSAVSAGVNAAAAMNSAQTAASVGYGVMNRNPSFVGLRDNTGDPRSMMPEGFGWGYWWSAPSLAYKVPGKAGGEGWVIGAQPEIPTGFSNAFTGAEPGWYVVRGAWELLDGGSSGCGIYLSLANAQGTEYSGAGFSLNDLAGDPEQQVPGLSPYRFIDRSRLVYLGDPNMRFIALVAMHRWAAFGNPVYTQMAWHHLSIRKATDSEIKANRVNAVEARISSVETVAANAVSAVADRTASLEARAGSLESRTGITEQAVANLQSGQASARLVLSAVTGGGVAQISLVSNNNGGAAVEIVGNVSISGQKLQDGTVGAGKLTVGELSAITANLGTVTAGVVRSADGLTEFNLNTGRQKFVTGGYRLVQGGNLGPNANMVLWYGPTSVAEGQETIANSAFALATDGKIYQGSAQINAAGETAQTVGIGVGITRVLGVGESVSLEASVGVTGATASGTLVCQIQVDGVVNKESAGAYIGPSEPAAAYIPATTYTNNTGIRRAFTFRARPNSAYGGTTNPALSWLTVG